MQDRLQYVTRKVDQSLTHNRAKKVQKKKCSCGDAYIPVTDDCCHKCYELQLREECKLPPSETPWMLHLDLI